MFWTKNETIWLANDVFKKIESGKQAVVKLWLMLLKISQRSIKKLTFQILQ